MDRLRPYSSKSYEQLQEETGELQPYLTEDFRENKILARFRKYIEGRGCVLPSR